MKVTPAPDPRFDPRFQRGYSGSEPLPPSEQIPPQPERPVVPPPELESPEQPVAESEPEPRVVTSPSAQPGFIDEAPWVPPPRNPYRLALLLAGVAMLLGAGILIWYSARAAIENNGFYDLGQQTLSTLENLVPPALIVGGLTSIIVWLVLGALATRHGRD